MPSATDEHASGDRSSPRRSGLTQQRSRDTRRKLIRAALELWNERGFDENFENTTADEIARAAGVSKGTFYFHFAHKEDILLEMSWATGELMAEEATAGMEHDLPTLDLVDQLMGSVGRRVSRAPRAAVLRVTGHWSRLAHEQREPENEKSFREAFRAVADYAIGRGDLPEGVDVDELAALLETVTMDALVRWAATDQGATELQHTLRRRARVVLTGAAACMG